MALYQLKKYLDACECFMMAKNIDEKYPDSYNNIGKINFKILELVICKFVNTIEVYFFGVGIEIRYFMFRC